MLADNYVGSFNAFGIIILSAATVPPMAISFALSTLGKSGATPTCWRRGGLSYSVRWFGFRNGSRDDPVRIVQRARRYELAQHDDALDATLGEQLWQLGTPFESFS